jgi:hypothetical protein
MTSSDVVTYSSWLFIGIVVVFNILYFFVVLPKLREAGRTIGGDGFVNVYQQRYVRAYFELLTDAEKRKWHNVIIRYSYFSSICVLVVFAAALFLF